MTKLLVAFLAFAATLAMTLTGCSLKPRDVVCFGNPPVCRSEDELFLIEPEILEGVRPYLADWATLPPEETEDQRLEIGEDLGVGIGVTTWDQTSTGEPVNVVYIQIEVFYEWSRGMLYVHDDVELLGDHNRLRGSGTILRPVEEHIYVFNSNY